MKNIPSKSTLWVLLIVCTALLSFKASMYFLSGVDTIAPMGKFVNGNLPTVAPQEKIILKEIHTQLAWESPQEAIAFPGTDQLLVVEMDGRFFLLEDNDNATTRTLVMDIRDRCWYYDWTGTPGSKHGGFQSLVFHPDFGKGTGKDYIYVYYLYHPLGDDTNNKGPYYNRLSRFTWTGNGFDANSELIMINQYDTARGHDGGGMAFGSDGFLYIAVGDEGTQNKAATQHTQKINDRFRSGVWRIDVDQQGGNISHPIARQPNNANVPNGSTASYTQGYYIPNDNPWATGNGENLEEFYAIGLRQPFRMSYDELSGGFWIGDVGSSKFEEVDFMDKPGLNFEWNYKEGSQNTGYSTKPANLIGEERDPIYDYGRNVGRAVIGGYVYRGTAIPSLYGKYIFGDNGNGQVFALTPKNNNSSADVSTIGNIGGSVFNGISSLGYTHDQEILVLKLSSGTPGGGKIFKITSAPENESTALPNLLSETGVFIDMANLETADGILPYNVNTPLWSDGTKKFRWVSLPQDGTVNSDLEKLGYSEEGPWSFPVGTVFIKHFEHPNGRRLETRLWIHGEDGQWFGSSYKWRANGLEADLLLGGATEEMVIAGESFTYAYPNTNQCVQCHNPNSGGSLGFNTRQLNRDITYPSTGRKANQLETLHSLGFIPKVNTENVLTSVAIDDNSKPLALRARSYFDANCAYCHQPGNTRANFDMRLPIDLANQNLINGHIIEDLNINGAVAIAPGKLDQSIAYLRTKSTDPQSMMPPMAKGRMDQEAVQLLEAWIAGLGANCEPDATTIVMGNTPLTDGNFMDAHSPHININRTDGYTNNTNEDVAVCINDFNFYARRLGNPVTPFIAKVNGENNFKVIAIGQTRYSSSYTVGINTFTFSDVSNDGIVLKPGESIASGFIDALPNGTGSTAGQSVIPAKTGGTQDDVWQSYKKNSDSYPALVMGKQPEGNGIAPHLARSYQFNIGLSLGEVPNTSTSPVVSLYPHINYIGSAANLGVGEYPSLANVGFENNAASSIKIKAGYKAELFSQENFGGTAIVLTSDDADLRQINFNDVVSSLKITKTEENNTNQNLALNKATQQSSAVLGGLAARAVDGNRYGVWTAGSVTHTNLENDPWWRVDLGDSYNISQINIYNRTDGCCTDRLIGATVYVGNVPSNNPADYQTVATLNSNQEQILNNLNQTGRYVWIRHTGNKILSLAEVEVYGSQDQAIAVSGISLNPAAVSLIAGETTNVTASISPNNADDKSVVWISSNQTIASVSPNGVITALAPGTAIITATTNDGGYQASSAVTVTPNTIVVTGVSLTPNNLTLKEGESANLTASISPADATNKELIWSSGEDQVVTVNNEGLITAINPGTATISVRTLDGNFTATSTITVTAATIAVSSISLDLTEGTVDVGFSGYITATIAPENATNPTVIWSSNDESVATVNQDGWVVAVGPGNVTITATTADGGYQATVIGTVIGNGPANIAVTGISLNPSNIELSVGNTTSLQASVSPEDATDKSISWSSSDDTIATVDANGQVTALTAGTAIISATTIDGGFTATSTITINPNAVAVTGVSLTPNNLTLNEGESTSLTASISPLDASNKSLNWATSDNAVATVDANGQITALAAGTAIIKVTTVDGGFTASSTIKIQKSIIPVTGIGLDITAGEVNVGYSGTITATIFPENATNQAVVWSSSNQQVGTVDQNGVVTAVGPGMVIISATTVDGGYTATLRGTVYADASGLSVSWGDNPLPTATSPLVFPSPSNGLMNVDLRIYQNKAVKVYIFNHLQQLVFQTNFAAKHGDFEEINASHLANGFYLILFESDKEREGQTIIINK